VEKLQGLGITTSQTYYAGEDPAPRVSIQVNDSLVSWKSTPAASEEKNVALNGADVISSTHGAVLLNTEKTAIARDAGTTFYVPSYSTTEISHRCEIEKANLGEEIHCFAKGKKNDTKFEEHRLRFPDSFYDVTGFHNDIRPTSPALIPKSIRDSIVPGGTRARIRRHPYLPRGL